MPNPTLGLSMIVRNGADTLRGCLLSVQGLVREIVVADTGSEDASRDIVREFGGKTIAVKWTDDFAEARNAALQAATADWILSLDADEELDVAGLCRIPELLSAVEGQVGGFVVPIRNYLPARHGSVNGNRAKENDGRCASAQGALAYAAHPVVRLFRRQDAIRYRGCIHEAVAPQILAAGFRLANGNFCIHHLGFLAQGRYREKGDFYLRLLQKKVRQEPRNPMAWLELARQFHEPFRRNEEALQCLDRALTLQPDLHAARLLAGTVHLDLGQDSQALAALEFCTASDCAAEREHCRGDAFHNLGRLPEAKAAYTRSLELAGPDPQLESKLGYVEVRLGEHREGFLKMQNALMGLPLGAELHERLIKGYLAAGMLPEAAHAAEEFSTVLVHPRTILRAAAIRAHMKQRDLARVIILRGLDFFPESAELKNAQVELSKT